MIRKNYNYYSICGYLLSSNDSRSLTLDVVGPILSCFSTSVFFLQILHNPCMLSEITFKADIFINSLR